MQTNPSSSKLYVSLIILLGIVGGYVVYSQWLSTEDFSTPPAVTTGQDNLKKYQNLKIDFSVIDSVISKGFTLFGESPVSPGVTGKKDIFAPF